MSGKIPDLRASNALKYLFNGRKGSILDVSGSNLGAAAITGTPTWARTRKGFGVYTPSVGTNYLSIGNPASLQLNTATIFAVATRSEANLVDMQTIMMKQNAFNMMFLTGAEPRTFGCWDNGGGAWRASTFSETSNGKAHLYAISFVSGAVNGTAFYVDGIPRGLVTTTVVNQLSDLRIGWGVGGGNTGLGGAILEAGIVNRVLRPDEHLEIYTDFLKEGWVADLGSTRRGVKHFIPAKTDADYARDGIVYDCDYVRQSDGNMRDLGPYGYAGTITGCPMPGPEGEGASFRVGERVDLPNVTQINSVPALAHEAWFKCPPSTFTAGDCLWYEPLDGTHQLILGYAVHNAAASAVRAYVCDGSGLSYVTTNATVLRAGCRQHLMTTFNAGVIKIIVDGEEYPTTAGGALPAATPNLAAAVATRLNYDFRDSTVFQQRMFVGNTSPSLPRSEYLKNFAQKLIWQAPGEDMPVSLVASYGVATPNALGGGWTITRGDWKISEDSQGRRWAECVTFGSAYNIQPNGFGTTRFTIFRALNVGSTAVQFMSSSRNGYISDATQSGYILYIQGTGQPVLGTVTGGAIAAVLTVSPVAYISLATAYEFTINRRPSDGRFTTYIKGGSFTSPVLMSSTGGGSNPSAAEVTYTTSKYIVLEFRAGDKILIHDPTAIGNPGHPRIWQGVLDPQKNEVP